MSCNKQEVICHPFSAIKLFGFITQDNTEGVLLISWVLVGNSHHFVLKEENAGGGSQAEEWAGSTLRDKNKEGAGDIAAVLMVPGWWENEQVKNRRATPFANFVWCHMLLLRLFLHRSTNK